MKIDGRCHCGFISYEAEVDPDKVYVCNCTDCQSISGSPFRWAVSIAEQDFTLRSGQPKTYVKTSDNGNKSHQMFCPDCASPLYSTAVRDGPSWEIMQELVHEELRRRFLEEVMPKKSVEVEL